MASTFLISFLGGDLLLNRNQGEGSCAANLQLFKEWSLRWFNYVGEWDDNIMHQKRNIWTLWYGVPLKAWSPRFFKMVSAKFGSLIHIDESTLSKQNLSRARILIKTLLQSLPKSDTVIKVEGKNFNIKIIEEIPCFTSEAFPMASDDRQQIDPPAAAAEVEKSQNSNSPPSLGDKAFDIPGSSRGNNITLDNSKKNCSHYGVISSSSCSNRQPQVGPFTSKIQILQRGSKLSNVDSHPTDLRPNVEGSHRPFLGPSASIDLNKSLMDHQAQPEDNGSISESPLIATLSPLQEENSFTILGDSIEENISTIPKTSKRMSRKEKVIESSLQSKEDSDGAAEAVKTWEMGCRIGVVANEKDEAVIQKLEKLIKKDSKKGKKEKKSKSERRESKKSK